MIEFEVTPRIPEEPIGWLDIKLPKSVMSKLQSYIESAKENPVNYTDKLVGNITKSLLIEDKDNWFFKTVLFQLINQFFKCYPLYTEQIGLLTKDVPYCLDKFWVNFQKENEFNPIHNHSGIFSFVIWVKIPTDWREQHALPISVNSMSPSASDFEFFYHTMLGQISHSTYLVDKESEGQMLFFPAKLMHTVHPFYDCDEERISLAGNIRFDTSENSMRQYRNGLGTDNALYS